MRSRTKRLFHPVIHNYSVIKVLIIATLFFIPGLISHRDFWIEDEARYAEVVREMITDNKWVVPYLNGHFYPDKPPVYFYLSAVSSLLASHISVFSMMIITFLSALVCVWALYRIAQLLYDEMTAYYSSLIFISTFLTVCCAQIVRMDMLLTALISASIYLFLKGHIKDRPDFFLFWLTGSIAMLVKGPLGLLIPVTAAISFLLYTRSFPHLKRLLLQFGIFIPFILTGIWFASAWFLGEKEFIRNVIFEQLLGRAGLTSAPMKEFYHPEPFYFYFLLLPALLLPWAPFLPRAVVKENKNTPITKSILFWWFITGFTIISLIKGKLFIYLLPMIPPLSIITGNYIKNQISKCDRWFSYEAAISITATFGTFTFALLFIKSTPYWEPINHSFLIPISGFILLFGIFILFRHISKIPVILTWGMGIISALLFIITAPVLNDQFSGKNIGQLIRQHILSGNIVVTHEIRPGILNFYAGTIIAEANKDSIISLAYTNNAYIIMKNKFYMKELSSANLFRIVEMFTIANEKYILVQSNAPKYRSVP